MPSQEKERAAQAELLRQQEQREQQRHEENSQHALPPYSGPSDSPSSSSHVHRQSASQGNLSSPAPPRYQGLPRLDYKLYSPPLFSLSSDATTLTSKASYLSTNASALIDLIRQQSTVPPKPILQIRGRRTGVVDFDIKLNLMHVLVPDSREQRIDYIRCVGDGERAFRGGVKEDVKPHLDNGGLEAWVRKFVEDGSSVKSFALDRVVANLDIPWLEGQIRSLLAGPLGYKGMVDVVFSTTHSRVVVQNPDKVNGFFTSVTTLFSGKNKYEVVKAVWPFANMKSGEAGRKCVVQSEEAWWREWRDAVRHAITSRRVGWVSAEDKLEIIMEGSGRAEQKVDWGFPYES